MQTCLNIAHCKILRWPHYPFQQPSYYYVHPPSKTSWKAYFYSLSLVSLTVFFRRSLFFSYQALSLLLHKNSFVRVTTDLWLLNPLVISQSSSSSWFNWPVLSPGHTLFSWLLGTPLLWVPSTFWLILCGVWLHLEELMTLDCPRALSLDLISFFFIYSLCRYSHRFELPSIMFISTFIQIVIIHARAAQIKLI